MEFGNKSMLAGLGLSMPEEQSNLVRTSDRQARELAGSGVAQLLDPGVMPILEEGATPWNIGMLGIGLATGGQGGKVVNFGTRLAKKNLSTFNRLKDEVFGKIDDYRGYLRSKREINELFEILATEGKEKVGFRSGLTPKQVNALEKEALSEKRRIQREVGEWRVNRLQKIKELTEKDRLELLEEVKGKIEDTKYTYQLLPTDEFGRITDFDMVDELTDDMEFFEELLMDVELSISPSVNLPAGRLGGQNVTDFKPKGNK